MLLFATPDDDRVGEGIRLPYVSSTEELDSTVNLFSTVKWKWFLGKSVILCENEVGVENGLFQAFYYI